MLRVYILLVIYGLMLLALFAHSVWLRRELSDITRCIKKMQVSIKATEDVVTERCDRMEKQIAEIPVEQIGAIYDSEKQFQEGLSNILNYGQQTFGLNKENIPHE